MKKKLLYILHSLTVGGAESLVVQMAESLSSKYQVGILCLDGKGALWSRCEEQGFWLKSLERKAGLRLGNFLSASEAIKEFSPDLIHAHQYTPFLYSAVSRILGKTNSKIIFTEHGRHYPDVVSFKRRFANKLLLAKQADIVTGVSEFSKLGLERNEGFDKHQIKVIYNGLQFADLDKTEELSIRQELGLAKNRKLIAFVGSLRPVKNPLSLLRAFSKITEEIKDLDLVFIGDGPLRGDLEKLIEQLELKKRVYLAGIRLPASPYFQDFDLFIQPSLSEACSLALLEAMYREVPVIVSDGGGGPELVENRKTGLIVEVNKDAQLCSAIKECFTEEKEVSERVEAAHARVRKEFNFATMLSAYEFIYEEAL